MPSDFSADSKTLETLPELGTISIEVKNTSFLNLCGMSSTVTPLILCTVLILKSDV